MPKQGACFCRWKGCESAFEDIEKLYAHLCDDHIGRKITHNLCLKCNWDDCGTTAAKRDHLASHLLVHLPLKPHRCPTCRKAFKRPQDLKKHEKTHTIEHKASLISKQPGYKAIRRRKHTSPAYTAEDLSYCSSLTGTPNEEASGSGSGTAASVESPLSCDQSGSSFLTSSEASNSTHRTSPTSMSPPLHDFINNIVEYNILSPEYDTEMIDRLDNLVNTIHQQPQDWTLPIQDQQDLTNLQLWLEQLSANIGSTAPMYPDLVSTEDMYLYNTVVSSSPSQPDDWKKVVYSSENPLTASLLHPQQETLAHADSGNNNGCGLALTPATIIDPGSLSCRPSFWTPGPTAGLNNIKLENTTSMDGPTPSDSVDFTLPEMVCNISAQPLHLFESSKRDVEMVVAQEAQTPSPSQQYTGQRHQDLTQYPDKRTLVNLMNYMKAPGSTAHDIKPPVATCYGKETISVIDNVVAYDEELDKLIGMRKEVGSRHKELSNGAGIITQKKATPHYKEMQTTVTKHPKAGQSRPQHAQSFKEKVAAAPRQIAVKHTISNIGGKGLGDTPKHGALLVSTKEAVKTVKSGPPAGAAPDKAAMKFDKNENPTSSLLQASSSHLPRPILSASSSSSTKMRITLPKEEPSPYADLIEKLRDLEIGEKDASGGDDDEDKVGDDLVARARHMSLVNQIYDAVLRAQKANAPPIPRTDKSTNTQQQSTPHSHQHHHAQELVSV